MRSFFAALILCLCALTATSADAHARHHHYRHHYRHHHVSVAAQMLGPGLLHMLNSAHVATAQPWCWDWSFGQTPWCGERHSVSRASIGGSVVASCYGREHHQFRTATGENYNPNLLTAAHRTLPFGTRLTVTNDANGRSVTVTINDRGPFVRGRELDLSLGACRAIGLRLGRVSVQGDG